MKIKLFIITYNNFEDLHNNLTSLFNSNNSILDLQLFIINNHSNFFLSEEYQDKITILHNYLRPDFSTGHLSRNWNQAIINGFKNLDNPDSDVVITCQDDTIFEKDWLNKLLDLHSKYNFIQMGIGDQLCSYLPESIKNIGLWDERFCGIGYQEADYFIRALIYNKEKTCLNDYQHGRLINSVNYQLCFRPNPPNIFSNDHKKSIQHHHISEKIFNVKWPGYSPNYWNNKHYHEPPVCSSIDNFIYYPYFEKDIINLLEKKYII